MTGKERQDVAPVCDVQMGLKSSHVSVTNGSGVDHIGEDCVYKHPFLCSESNSLHSKRGHVMSPETCSRETIHFRGNLEFLKKLTAPIPPPTPCRHTHTYRDPPSQPECPNLNKCTRKKIRRGIFACQSRMNKDKKKTRSLNYFYSLNFWWWWCKLVVYSSLIR